MRKIPRNTIIELGRLLLDNSVALDVKEFILMHLKHSDTKEALEALRRYNKNPDEKLAVIAKRALRIRKEAP